MLQGSGSLRILSPWVTAFARASALARSPSSALARMENVMSVRIFFARTRLKSSITSRVLASGLPILPIARSRSRIRTASAHVWRDARISSADLLLRWRRKRPSSASTNSRARMASALLVLIVCSLMERRLSIENNLTPSTDPAPSSTSRGWAISIRMRGRGWPSTGQHRSLMARASSSRWTIG